MPIYGVDVAIQVGVTLLIEAASQEEASDRASDFDLDALSSLVRGLPRLGVRRAYSSEYDRLDEPLGRLVVDVDEADGLPWAEAFTHDDPEEES